MKFHEGSRFGLCEKRQSLVFWSCQNLDLLPSRTRKILRELIKECAGGEEKALEAQRQAKAAFGGNAEDMPTFEANGLTNVIDIIAAAGVAKSKSEARRLIEGNAISVDDTKITVADVELSDEIKQKGSFVLHKGKKVHINILL